MRNLKLLGVKYKPFADFDVFDEESLPSNSDVVFVLAQYINCMETLRAENIELPEYEVHWCWIIDGEASDIVCAPPQKLKGK